MRHRQPEVVGRYIIDREIASGGAATVYLARLAGEAGFSRIIAAKRLRASVAQDDAFIMSLKREARLLSRIRHPNVVAPLDVVSSQGGLTIFMEYVHGVSLSELTRAVEGPFPVGIAVGILVQALLGLHAAHDASGARGEPLHIVHLDVSPQNLLVGKDGMVRVVDFGIARAMLDGHQGSGTLLHGKMGYLAPEQLSKLGVDRRTDVFAAGVVLWELLTGQRLFERGSEASPTVRGAEVTVEPPSKVVPLSPLLDAVVLRSLSSDPLARYATAQEMASALMSAVPVASPLEISAWVESVAGHALARREELVAALDQLSPDGITLPVTANSAVASNTLAAEEGIEVACPIQCARPQQAIEPPPETSVASRGDTPGSSSPASVCGSPRAGRACSLRWRLLGWSSVSLLVAFALLGSWTLWKKPTADSLNEPLRHAGDSPLTERRAAAAPRLAHPESSGVGISSAIPDRKRAGLAGDGVANQTSPDPSLLLANSSHLRAVAPTESALVVPEEPGCKPPDASCGASTPWTHAPPPLPREADRGRSLRQGVKGYPPEAPVPMGATGSGLPPTRRASARPGSETSSIPSTTLHDSRTDF